MKIFVIGFITLLGCSTYMRATEKQEFTLREKYEFHSRVSRTPGSSQESPSSVLKNFGGNFIHSGENANYKLLLGDDEVIIFLGGEKIEIKGRDYRSARLGMPLTLPDGRSVAFFLNAEKRSEITIMIFQTGERDLSIELFCIFSLSDM